MVLKKLNVQAVSKAQTGVKYNSMDLDLWLINMVNMFAKVLPHADNAPVGLFYNKDFIQTGGQTDRETDRQQTERQTETWSSRQSIIICGTVV